MGWGNNPRIYSDELAMRVAGLCRAGYSYREISKIVGIPRESVGTLYCNSKYHAKPITEDTVVYVPPPID